MKRNKGQGLVEYALILVLVLIVVIIIVVLVTWPTPTVCDQSKPTAGQIIDCMATRTAEARHK